MASNTGVTINTNGYCEINWLYVAVAGVIGLVVGYIVHTGGD